ncbi:Uncharacterised protein [uncultured archaeon]|nr:Uncharacterised protein [uncultured archaeon]
MRFTGCLTVLLAAIVVACVVEFFFAGVDAVVVNATVRVGNVPPQVGDVVCVVNSGQSIDRFPYTPSPDTDYWISCQALITDRNSFQDVTYVNFTFYRLDSGEGPADEDVRYGNASACRIEGGSGITAFANCTVGPIRYFADWGKWAAKVYAKDSFDAEAIDLGVVTINPLVAIDQSSDISFGAMKVGESGTQWRPGFLNASAVTFNGGNADIFITITSPAMMSCNGPRNISVGNISFSVVADSQFPGGCVLGEGTLSWCDELANATVFDREQPLEGGDMLWTFWGVHVPEGIRGSCWTSIFFNALQR